MYNFLALVGFLLPPLIDMINNKVADSRMRFWVSVLVCMVVGTGIEYVLESGLLTFDGVSEQIMLTFGMAQLSYGALWEDSKADIELKKIQA